MPAGPIALTAQLALAVREGRKTQTRRPVTLRRCCERDARLEQGVPHNLADLVEGGEPNAAGALFGTQPYLKVPYCAACDAAGDRIRAPFAVGEVRWVREPARVVAVDSGEPFVSGVREGARVEIEYLADGERRWVSCSTRLASRDVGQRLPYGCHREAARTLVEVVDVRLERLQAITEAGARAEGATFHDGGGVGHSGWRLDLRDVHSDARSAFARVWGEVYDARGYGWARNPWVSVATFRLSASRSAPVSSGRSMS